MQKKTMLMAGTKEMMTGVKLTQALNPKACISALKSSLTGKVLSVKKLVYSTSSAPMDMQTIGMNHNSASLDTLGVAWVYKPDALLSGAFSEPRRLHDVLTFRST
jgi:hypothetical protein